MAELSGTGPVLASSQVASSFELLELIHKDLKEIPEAELRTGSRSNVRPDSEKTSLQMSLGLVISGTWRAIPMPSKKTYQYLRLQQNIVAYVQLRAREQGMDLTDFTFTSMQITKNLQSKRHLDKNNRGFSGGIGLELSYNFWCNLSPWTEKLQ